jgi:hypothetical protein
VLHEKIAYALTSNFSIDEEVLHDPHPSCVSKVGEKPEVYETYETLILLSDIEVIVRFTERLR